MYFEVQDPLPVCLKIFKWLFFFIFFFYNCFIFGRVTVKRQKLHKEKWLFNLVAYFNLSLKKGGMNFKGANSHWND